MTALTPAEVTTRNLILDYYDRFPEVIEQCIGDAAPVEDGTAFSPGFELPELDGPMREFFAVAEAGFHELGKYSGSRLLLLDLMRNPGTNTTKTVASLMIVARAVQYIRRTGKPVLIFTPTSANKGVALRDAVGRAIATGVVGADQLRVVTLAPRSGLGKLRGDRLSADPYLCARNPVLLYDGPQPEDVKVLGRRFVTEYGTSFATACRLWFSLELNNYLVADAARAFLEQDVAPAGSDGPGRVHAHAVSSAFGLLGYTLGRDLLEAKGTGSPADRPGYLLVQHLGTPDMVLHLHYGTHDRTLAPRYLRDERTGLFHQSQSPYFPLSTADPEEVLDTTFYSRAPATNQRMSELIRRFGGSGIVVSLHECLDRYPHLRSMLAGTSRPLPADARTVREWSLVMAITGTFNALDRGLLPGGSEVVVHGSGFYTTADFRPLEPAAIVDVRTSDDINAVLRERVAP